LDILKLLDNHIIISKTDANGIINYVNKAFCKISKYSKAELIGKSHNIVRHPDMPDKIFENIWQTITNGKVWSGLIKNRAKDNSTYYVKTIIIPLKKDGKIKEYLAFRQDITKIIKTKKLLAVEKTLLQKVLDNSNNIVIIRKNFEPIKVNNRFFTVLPFNSLREFKSKHQGIQELFIENKKYFYTNDQKWEKLFQGQTLKVILKNRKNQERIFSLYVNSFKLNKEHYSVLTLNDITHIEKEKEKAKELEQLKSQFLANISHEVRTPLNSIIGYINLLETSSLNSTQKEYATIVKQSSEFLLDIVNSILDFSKIESSKMIIETRKNNIYELIISTFNALKPLALKKGIDFILEIKNLNECYFFDALRIRQILTNLLNNAIKFTNRGFVKLEIDGLNFKVIDSGIGIKKDKIDTIFEAYLQSKDDITRKYGGTGLGLTITKKLIEMIGGRLKVESEIKKGSTFSFYLPLKECNKFKLNRKIKTISLKNNKFEKEFKAFFENLGILISDNSNTILTTDSSLENAILIEDENNYLYEAYYKLYNSLLIEKIENLTFNGKILVADDYEFNRKLINELLKKYNLILDFAEDGEEAVEKALKNDYDLILMDITMPKLDGFEASKKIKEVKNTPIIAMTANAFKDDLHRFIEVMDNYLVKPFKKSDLISLLKEYLKAQKIDDNIMKISKRLELSYSDSENLIDTFLNSIKKDLPILEDAIKNRNYETIYREFHKLKSSSGYLGLDKLSDISSKLMMDANLEKNVNYQDGLELIYESIDNLKNLK